MTLIAMCRLRGSIHIGQIANGSGTKIGIGQRTIGETAVVIPLFVGTLLSAAIAVLQLHVVAAESASARGTESRTDDAVGPLAAEAGHVIE